MAASEVYELEKQINTFFSQTSTTRGECDRKVKELSGTDGQPCFLQGNCSYTVFAGDHFEQAFQFRLHALPIDLQRVLQAREVYGDLVPETSFHGGLGSSDGPQEPVLVYQMRRVPGISYIEALVTSNHLMESPEQRFTRSTIIADLARLFARSWKRPQTISNIAKQQLQKGYLDSLRLLLKHLPAEFHPAIEQCIQDIGRIMSLPMVLTHQDLSTNNVIVDQATGKLNGVIDWAEADVCPFGYNLDMLRTFASSFWLKTGWQLYSDHDDLTKLFWQTFQAEVGNLGPEEMQAIVSCRDMGCLLSHGFTMRLANMPLPVPIGDDEKGRYNKLALHGYLVNPDTRLGLDRI